MVDIKFYNVIVLGLCFMLIFTAFQTSSNVQTSVLNNVRHGEDYPFRNKGYVSLAIIYTVFSLANFIAPPICHLFGARVAMFIGGVCYCLFIGAIIYPYLSTLYIASVIVGVGAALIWTGQGNFLTLNSTDETMGRNSGIFWALLQCSLLFGNMLVYFYFAGKTDIDNHEREVLYTILLVACGIGTLAFIFLRKPPQNYQLLPQEENTDGNRRLDNVARDNTEEKPVDTSSLQTPLESFLAAFKLFGDKNMMLLAVTIAYTGLSLTFFSGVYGTSVGNIDPSKLSDPKRQLGLIGMMIGAGEITGGLLFGIFGKYTNKFGRDPIVLIGFIAHMVTFYLIFLNLPDEAPLRVTHGESKLHYNLGVYAFCAYTLGFGDASFNTQLYSITGTLWSSDSAPAFALFKCIQSVAAAIAFAYGTKLVLKYQLLILVIMCFLGTVAFFRVERKNAKPIDPSYESIS